MKALEIVNTAKTMNENLKELIEKMTPSPNPVDHLANVINLIKAESKLLKTQEAILANQRKSLEQLVEMAENSVFEEMQAEGLVELGGGLIKYVIKLNPHKLIIEDEKLIPNDFKRSVVTTEIRKDAIKDELKMGKEIPGCKLVQDQSLQMKTNS